MIAVHKVPRDVLDFIETVEVVLTLERSNVLKHTQIELLLNKFSYFGREHTAAVNSIVVSTKYDYIISGSEDKTIVICSLEGVKKCVLKSHSKGVTGVRLNSSNSILASGNGSPNLLDIWGHVHLSKPSDI